MKMHSLLVLFLSSSVAFHANANTLIITRGPICCAMGSYLSNAIKSVDDTYNTFAQNDISNFAYYQVFNELFPQHMAIISKAINPENISYAITNYHVYFKDTAYAQQKEQALDAIAYIRNVLNDPSSELIHSSLIAITQHSVMAELAYHAACKHNVVWEGGTIVNFDKEATALKNSFDTVIETITYCPPTKMIEQWLQKDTQATNEQKAYKKRILRQVLQSFFNNFIPTNNEQDAAIILTKDEFDTIIQQATDYIATVPQNEQGEDGVFTRTEFTLEGLAEFKAKIYSQCNFDTVDYVALTPSLSCDVLLSSREDCLNFAQRIANGDQTFSAN